MSGRREKAKVRSRVTYSQLRTTPSLLTNLMTPNSHTKTLQILLADYAELRSTLAMIRRCRASGHNGFALGLTLQETGSVEKSLVLTLLTSALDLSRANSCSTKKRGSR